MVEEKPETKKTEKEKTARAIKIDTEEMAKAGVHFGHRVSRLHPKMKPYIYGVKNTVHFIDLEKTGLKLKEALAFIENFIKEGGNLLLVGTKIQVRDLIKKIAEEFSLPYVTERWLGGTLTNFEEMKKRLAYFKDLKAKEKAGKFEEYTKLERMKLKEELEKLEKKFGGLKELESLPGAVFVADMKKDKLACKEARRKGIKVIGIADTNIDPSLADFPIPANDDAISSLNYILGKIREAIKRGREAAEKEKETKTKIEAKAEAEEKSKDSS